MAAAVSWNRPLSNKESSLNVVAAVKEILALGDNISCTHSTYYVLCMVNIEISGLCRISSRVTVPVDSSFLFIV